MRPRRVALACIAASAALLFACNAITGLSDDFNLATTDGAPGSSGEAGSSGTDGNTSGGPDGSSSGNDGSSGGTDSGSDTGPTGPFCDSVTAQYCNDFETDAGTGFNAPPNPDGTVMISLDATAGVGGSGAMHVVLSQPGSSSSNGWWVQTVAGDHVHYELSFAFQLVSSTGAGDAVFGEITWPNVSGGDETGIEVEGTTLTSNKTPASPVTLDHVWHVATITFDKSGTSYDMVSKIDTTTVATASIPEGKVTMGAELRFGAFSTGSLSAATINIDNIAASWHD